MGIECHAIIIIDFDAMEFVKISMQWLIKESKHCVLPVYVIKRDRGVT